MRIGMIVPSSNTALEGEVASLGLSPAAATFHMTRVRVTTVSLESRASAQFEPDGMVAAGLLLADAGVGSLMWAGTSGSWLGIDHDRSLAASLTDRTGVPSSTSTLALLDACRMLRVFRVALVTPYVETVVDRITRNYRAEGIEVVGEGHLGITDNHAFGLVPPDRVWDLVVGCDPVGIGADAVVVACTNLRGTGLVADLEDYLGMPVLDSIAVTVWQALTLAGAANPGSPRHPGRMGGAPVAAGMVPTEGGSS